MVYRAAPRSAADTACRTTMIESISVLCRRGRRHPVPPGTAAHGGPVRHRRRECGPHGHRRHHRYRERVELPDIAYRGNGPVTTGLALEADSYTVAVARDSAAGVTYLRIVNAMAEPVSVGLSQTLDALGIPAASRASAMATVLTADNPYAGVRGEEAPTRPVERPCELMSGMYEAPAWSFTVIALN